MPINKDTPTSEIIHDFVKSKNPKFAGKSKAERVKQAVAASYKVHGEEVEESNNTPYVRKSKTNPNAWDAMNKHGKVKTFGAEFKDSAMRHAGISEDIEQVDEEKPKKDFMSLFPARTDGPGKFTISDIENITKVKSSKNNIKKEETELDEMAGANMDRRALVSHIKKKGWTPKSSGGSGDHEVYVHPRSTQRLVVPRHNALKAPLILDVLKKSKVMDKEMAEEVELDEARGRPKKDLGYTVNPNNKEKLYHDNPEHMDRIRRLRKNGVLPPEQHAPSEHIINRLRQASTNQTGGQDIKYENGKTHHVSGSMASKTLDHYNSLPKPADKEAFQAKIRKSHEEHKSALGEQVMSEETKAPLWGVSSSNKFRTLDEKLDPTKWGIKGALAGGALGAVAGGMAAAPHVHHDPMAIKGGATLGAAGGAVAGGTAGTALAKGINKIGEIGNKLKKKVTAKEEAELEEKKLIGKQKKLDKNHNDKLDAEDFKMLRKEELMDQFADALEEGIFDESDIDRLVENELADLDENNMDIVRKMGQSRTLRKYVPGLGKNEAGERAKDEKFNANLLKNTPKKFYDGTPNDSHEKEKAEGGRSARAADRYKKISTKEETELEEMDKSPETKFDRAGQDRAKDKTATPIGAKKFAKDAEVAMNKSFSKEETIRESVVTPYTAASRYHAVESAVRDIMSQNQNLKKIAEEETFRRNNPGLFKDK